MILNTVKLWPEGNKTVHLINRTVQLHPREPPKMQEDALLSTESRLYTLAGMFRLGGGRPAPGQRSPRRGKKMFWSSCTKLAGKRSSVWVPASKS